MSSTTTFYGLYLPSIGDGSANGQLWGQQVNNNFTTIDTTMNGLVTKVNPRTTGTFQHGTAPDYFEMEATGFPVRHGAAEGWKDIVFPIIPKFTGAGNPNYVAFIGGVIKAPRFAVGDGVDLDASEFIHDWQEGTDLHIHLHWTSMTNVAATRGVKWQVALTYVNDSNGGVWTPEQTFSVDVTVPANTPANTEFITPIATVPVPSGKIGGQMRMRLDRVASALTAPATSPFATQLGVHLLCDTDGSRSIATK